MYKSPAPKKGFCVYQIENVLPLASEGDFLKLRIWLIFIWTIKNIILGLALFYNYISFVLSF